MSNEDIIQKDMLNKDIIKKDMLKKDILKKDMLNKDKHRLKFCFLCAVSQSIF